MSSYPDRVGAVAVLETGARTLCVVEVSGNFIGRIAVAGIADDLVRFLQHPFRNELSLAPQVGVLDAGTQIICFPAFVAPRNPAALVCP